MPDDPTRAQNPLQKIQGYIELGGATVTTTEPQPRLIKTQELLPNKDVRLVYPGTDIPAPMYREDGTRITDLLVTADGKAFYSFYSETGQYDIRFTEPGTSPIVEIFRRTDVKVESLIFNVRDYGARGNGVDDDTVAIRAALAAMIAANPSAEVVGVGTLFFPNGRYLVSQQADLLDYILDLPSGIVIQGTAGPYSGDGRSNCQIVLTSDNGSIFRIRTNRHKIIFRDIGLTSATSNGTIAIDVRETEENFAGTNSSNIEFDNLTIWKFERGISIEGAGKELQWDITGVRVNHCIIVECLYSIYVNSQNCDFMRIVDSRIGGGFEGFGIYLNRVGIITIDSVLGAGHADEHGPLSDTFIYLTAGRGTVTIINCECEGFNYSVQVQPVNVGNISWPILFLNCAWGPTVQLSSQCEVTSIASRYQPETVQCDPQVEVMFYSFGDSVIGLDKIPNPEYDFHLNKSQSRFVSRANRYRLDFQRPARFGGQAGKIATLLTDTALAVSPFDDNETHIALCNPEGAVLFNIRADASFIYFEAPGTTTSHPPKKLMRLDSNGNLTVRGLYAQDSNL